MKKPICKLTGTDGNAFAIMGRVRDALKKAGFSKTYIKNYTKKAKSGNYYNLLQVSMEYVDVI